MLTILCGCSSVKTPAGPTCVSCKPYHCRGSWHYPQRYYEYDEVGLASWYGDDWVGKPKATGEPFNKNAFTAAHRTLPIPSIVRVTSLRNGRSIIVLIDDRGPFVYEGRIIDLSCAAARELNVHMYKPSPVRVECLVGESLRLSQYIARYCKHRRDPYGRSWIQIYYQEIAKTHPMIHNREPSHYKKMGTQRRKRYNGISKYMNLNKL
jgi:rare lipoprotein A (peptidoglycan hydrolase)